jgi:sec-independent protein translocase protein TatA
MTPFIHHFAGFLGLGGPEVIIILVIVLVLFGGSKLPELAKGLGKSIKEFKQATREDSAPLPPPAAPAPAPVAPVAEKSAERTG